MMWSLLYCIAHVLSNSRKDVGRAHTATLQNRHQLVHVYNASHLQPNLQSMPLTAEGLMKSPKLPLLIFSWMWARLTRQTKSTYMSNSARTCETYESRMTMYPGIWGACVLWVFLPHKPFTELEHVHILGGLKKLVAYSHYPNDNDISCSLAKSIQGKQHMTSAIMLIIHIAKYFSSIAHRLRWPVHMNTSWQDATTFKSYFVGGNQSIAGPALH